MEAAAAAFVAVSDRAGLSIGIVPRDPDGPFDLPDQLDGQRYPNPHVEITIMTPLRSFTDDWRRTPARNHVNVLSADVIIALPGNKGTRNELDMAAEYCGEAARPRQERRTILYGPADRFTTRHRELFVHAEKLGDVEAHLRRVLAARGLALGSPR